MSPHPPRPTPSPMSRVPLPRVFRAGARPSRTPRARDSTTGKNAVRAGLHSEELTATGHRESDGPGHQAEARRRTVLGAGDGHQRVEEPALVALGGREVEGEAGVGPGEAAVDIAVTDRFVAPLVEVEVGRVKHLVTGAGGTVLQDHGFPLPFRH